MKLWSRECHLLTVTSCAVCYLGATHRNEHIRYIKWCGYLCGDNKVVNFKQEDPAGTYVSKGNQSIRYYNHVVVQVTHRLFFTSYIVMGRVSRFYKLLPKEEQEAIRKLWERSIENEFNTNK